MRRGFIILAVFLILFDVSAQSDEANKILGSWQTVITNPTYPNSIARRYMRHTFKNDGTVIIENEESSSYKRQWKHKNGVFFVTWRYNDIRFTESYRFLSADELHKFYFTREVAGKKYENKKDDLWLREGSTLAKKRRIVNLFSYTKKAKSFVDPNNLELYKTYVLSKKTPLMPHDDPSDPMAALMKIKYLRPNSKIRILLRRETKHKLWYKVRAKIGNEVLEGWINSTALIGQSLK